MCAGILNRKNERAVGGAPRLAAAGNRAISSNESMRLLKHQALWLGGKHNGICVVEGDQGKGLFNGNLDFHSPFSFSFSSFLI